MSSALRTAKTAITQRMDANWTATPVAYEDAPFTPPDGRWVQLTVLWGDGAVDTMSGRNRIPGVLTLNVFGKPGRGAGEVMGLCDQLRDLWNRQVVGPVRFDAASGPKPSVTGGSEWVQRTVDVPFTVEEVVT